MWLLLLSEDIPPVGDVDGAAMDIGMNVSAVAAVPPPPAAWSAAAFVAGLAAVRARASSGG